MMTPSPVESASLRRASLCAVLLATSWCSVAIAHEADDPHRHREKAVDPRFDADRYRTNRYGAFEFRVGPYLPQVDSDLSGTPYEDSFGDKPSISVGLEADFQILHIPHLGSLGPGIGLHYSRRSGKALFGDPEVDTPNAGERSAHPHSLWLMPMYAVAVFRLDLFKRDFNIPIVPYAKGGFAMGLWEARDASELSEAEGVKGRGLETGLQFQLGGMLYLNPLAPQAALDMDNSTGVNDAYLFVEWWKSDLNSFGKGLQMGTSTWMAGITVEY